MNESPLDYELFHYGIKGMRWGVRKRDETSPRSRSSADEKASLVKKSLAKSNKIPGSKISEPRKLSDRQRARIDKLSADAKRYDDQVSKFQKEIDELPPGFLSSFNRRSLSSERDRFTSYRDRALKDAEVIRSGKGLTTRQKQVIAGAVVVGALASVVVLSNMSESGQLNSIALRGKAYLNGQDGLFDKSSLFSAKSGSDTYLTSVAKGANPNYKSAGGKMNCRRATMAYEMRRRGYAVHATTSAMGYGQNESGLINAFADSKKKNYSARSMSAGVVTGNGIRFKNDKDSRINPAFIKTIADASKHDNVKSALMEQPEGARGEIVFNFKRFAHSMAYERTKDGVVVIDAQKGQLHKVHEEGWAKLMDKWGTPGEAEVTRLDNMNFDDKFISRWVTND